MGYAATAGWPLRKVVDVHPVNEPGQRFDATETLECGHEISPPGWVYKPAKRRRCEECSNEIGRGITTQLRRRHSHSNSQGEGNG